MKNHIEAATPETLAKALFRPTKKTAKTPRKRKHHWSRRTKAPVLARAK